MDISYVLEFVVLADTKSFSAASYQLHMSQAALSKHIQSMERELGHPLFIRTTSNVEISEYGQIYLPYARQISENVRKAEAARIAFEKRSDARTIIGVVHNPDLFMATELISGFRREYPGIPIQIFEGSLKELRREFLMGRLHIISMAYSTWEKAQNHFIPAGKSRLTALIPKDHFLAEYESIPLRHLGNVPGSGADLFSLSISAAFLSAGGDSSRYRVSGEHYRGKASVKRGHGNLYPG